MQDNRHRIPPCFTDMASQAVVLLMLAAALPLTPTTQAVNFTIASPTKMPPFVRRCSFKDPNLVKCCIDSGNDALQHVIKGYPPLGIPSFDPLVVDEIEVSTGNRPSSLKLIARNIVISGLANISIEDIRIDIKNQTYLSISKVPLVQIIGDYEVDGQVLLLPIKGKGSAKFTFDNCIIYFSQKYKLVKKPDGNIYHELPYGRVDFDTSHAHFQLDNLFNGDKLLGEQINNFLNENWRDVFDDLVDPFMTAVTKVVDGFAHALATKIPYTEIFTDVDIAELERSQKIINIS